jgi:hypothetical protein
LKVLSHHQLWRLKPPRAVELYLERSWGAEALGFCSRQENRRQTKFQSQLMSGSCRKRAWGVSSLQTIVTSMAALVMVTTMTELNIIIATATIIIIFKIIITESQQRKALRRTRVAEQATTAARRRKTNEINDNTNRQQQNL